MVYLISKGLKNVKKGIFFNKKFNNISNAESFVKKIKDNNNYYIISEYNEVINVLSVKKIIK